MYGILRHILIFMFVVLLSNTVSAQVDSNLSKDAFDKYREEMFNEFDSFRSDAVDEYNGYAEAMRAEYNAFLSSVKSMWGKDNAVEDTKTVWVEYGDDLKSRSIVDFEKGKIEVEILLDDVSENESSIINQRLMNAVDDLLNSRGETLPYKSEIDKQQPLSQSPILAGLVDFSKYNIPEKTQSPNNKNLPLIVKPKKKTPPAPVVKGKILNPDMNKKATVNKSDRTIKKKPEKGAKKSAKSEQYADDDVADDYITEDTSDVKGDTGDTVVANSAETIAEAVVEQSLQTTSTIKGEDEKVRKVVKIEMALVSDNLSKNAAVYKDYVEQYSRKFEIEQPLIFAVMEQESCFNPKAKSWVPAYGLMQLVPTSGGYDAYRYVYKNDWVPTQSYLYIPHQNIELGTAYLRILMNQFSSVIDPDCRRLCVIASYNTGAGNVSRAFTGNTNIKKAIPLINEYSYQQLFEYLTSRLGSDEARKYVSGVSKRREKYIK